MNDLAIAAIDAFARTLTTQSHIAIKLKQESASLNIHIVRKFMYEH